MVLSDEILVEFAQNLVRTPSVLGNERAVAERTAEMMAQSGYDAVETDSVGNVIGVVQGKYPGPTLLLDAHMDTVDVLAESDWKFDPFGGQIDGSRLYGRGSSDMKGALAAMVFGISGLERSRLFGRAVVVASVGEETTEGSALAPVIERYLPDFVIIGEATGLQIARAGRGRAEFLIKTRGKPAHASTPHLGENAVHQMMSIVSEIEGLPMPRNEFVGTGVMCLTDIISRPYPAHSVVPSECRVTYERRLLPGEEEDGLRRQLRDCCLRAGCPETSIDLAEARYTSYTGWSVNQRKWYSAWETPEACPLVRKASEGLSSVGIEPRYSAYQFCTNAALSAGVKRLPTIGFGPSRETLAHIVDEYIELEQLMRARSGYQAIARTVLQG
ncbi:MAG: YgeY family selenium metabolism-linked hydrolase [Acidobacteriota bacterium]|nr:MAG: YgeY family selenium metabolism-linked hydrolase [Acidobacteriota bacterium]